MADDELQTLCDLGSRQLIEMDYLAAEETLAKAEQRAWATRDFDSLSRLYMPLQEARRQRRQRCGEGIVRLDLLAPSDSPMALIDQFTQGQILIAGWGSLAPAIEFRRLCQRRSLYAETFLAAVYPVAGGQRAVVIVPTDRVQLPTPVERNIDSLLPLLPPHSIVLHESELPQGSRPGSPETFGQVMGMWERLHAPFLAAADMQADPLRKIEHYRRVIEVDYACELAHQKLSDVARQLSRAAAAC